VTIELTIHGTGEGICALSGKSGEGLTVTFKDGTLSEGFLSHKAFFALVKMKFAQASKPSNKPAPVPLAPPPK
jgi:hypothetical protein